MENLFFIIISSFLPLSLLTLFAESNSSMAQPPVGQPQTGQPQRGSSLSSLKAYSLSTGPITENDMPKIKTLIQQVLSKISEPVKSSGTRADNQTIKSCILLFLDWLNAQGCVSRASTTYDIEKSDRYSDNIFLSHPGQLPFDITFKMEGKIEKPYRLLIFVTTVHLFEFASLVGNKSIGGVPVPKTWPKDAWSYWDEHL
jgi:hypothetical protein